MLVVLFAHSPKNMEDVFWG